MKKQKKNQPNDPQSTPGEDYALEQQIMGIVQDGLDELKEKKAALMLEYNDLHAASGDPQLLETNMQKMQTIATKLKKHEDKENVICERMKQAFGDM